MSGDLLETIDAAIQLMQTQLTTKEGAKGTLTDLIRLLQLRKELDADRPRQVSARWIEEKDECKTPKD